MLMTGGVGAGMGFTRSVKGVSISVGVFLVYIFSA